MRDIKWDKHKFCRDMKCDYYYSEICECMADEPELDELELEQKCYTNRELFGKYGNEYKPDVVFTDEVEK